MAQRRREAVMAAKRENEEEEAIDSFFVGSLVLGRGYKRPKLLRLREGRLIMGERSMHGVLRRVGRRD